MSEDISLKLNFKTKYTLCLLHLMLPTFFKTTRIRLKMVLLVIVNEFNEKFVKSMFNLHQFNLFPPSVPMHKASFSKILIPI